MNRKPLIRSALRAMFLVCSFAAGAAAFGQHVLEIVPLRHRTAEQILPAVRVVLEPGGTLSAQGNQLIVRTSPANLEELKRTLEAIDRPLRRLQLSVRFDDAGASSRQAIAARGRVGPTGTGLEARAFHERSAQVERVDQRLQVLEGARAFIMAGEVTLEPLYARERSTGFEATARLAGDRVFVDIAPQRAGGGEQRQIGTTVSAGLGEWFEVSRVATSALQRASSSQVWLKIDELK